MSAVLYAVAGLAVSGLVIFVIVLFAGFCFALSSGWHEEDPYRGDW